MSKVFILWTLVIFYLKVNDCAKILGVFPCPGYSQFILGEVLMTELARRGHDVTVISAYTPREKLENYKTILTDGLVKGPQPNLFPREKEHFINRIRSVHNLGYRLTESTLSHPDVQNLIHSNKTFDIVVLEQFHNEAHMGFGVHFNAPVVLFSSIGISEWNSHLMGDLRLPSIIPVTKTHYTDHMSFFQRLMNGVINLSDIIYKEFVSFPIQQEYLNKYFPKKMNLIEIMYNASLMLLNSHVSTAQSASLTTAVVEIGGFHITPQKLPDDVQRFLDGSEHGAILFSMGTNLNSTNLPSAILKDIIETFSKMKQKVLWKFEQNSFENMPSNVLVSEWLPQSDVLGHPNVVAFITHGGLLSVTEAIYYGVPMVGTPIFGDQRMNVARCVQKGIALHLPLQELTGYTLHKALIEVLDNSKYRENARKYSNILRDRPVRPLDLAMYWIEYILRHNGAVHLRNASLTLYWFQLYMIDVFVFLTLCPLALYYTFRSIVAKKCTIQRSQPKNSSVEKFEKKIKLKKH